jgi:uncharacterized hydrophobic protein (TIGR00271 family)
MAIDKNTFNIRSLFVYLKYKLRLPRDRDNMGTTIESVRSGATMTGANLWVLVTAIFTASLGLNVNSTAVIIGAMLISPLMGPIMAIGMGVAIHDFGLVFRSLKNFALAVALSITASSLYFFISPLKVPGSELLARTSPTIYDVLIAVFGGLAGIIAGSGKLRQSNVIPGVAIATALMPPLCTVGFGIANLNPTYIIGAFYLFFINTVFISLSTYFIVRLLRYPVVENIQGKKAKQIRQTIIGVVMIALLPSIYLTYQIVRKYIFEEKAKNFVSQEFSDTRRLIIKTETKSDSIGPLIKVTILGSEIDSSELNGLQNRLKVYGLDFARLEIQQGFADVSRRGTLIGNINSSIEANSQAIGKVFADLEELRNISRYNLEKDSLQAKIGREAQKKFSDLNYIRVEPVSFYRTKGDSTVKGWSAQLRFDNSQASEDITTIKNWLLTQLPGDTLILQIQ